MSGVSKDPEGNQKKQFDLQRRLPPGYPNEWAFSDNKQKLS